MKTLSQVNEKQSKTNIFLITETWVYVSEGEVMGFISLLGNNVVAPFVHPSMQRKGIGKFLMDHAKALRGQLELGDFKSNRIGRDLRDRYGFEIVKKYVHESTGRPIFRMQLNET